MSVTFGLGLPMEMGRVDRKEGGQWGGGISMMECLGEHTFLKQHWVTQLVTP